MNQSIKLRIMQEANHILSTGETLRQTAKIFGVSKSTVHLDMSKRLRKIDKKMYMKVNKKLNYNFSQKHIRGGISTANKYNKKNT